jgi:hypothetical protein
LIAAFSTRGFAGNTRCYILLGQTVSTVLWLLQIYGDVYHFELGVKVSR